MIDVKKLVTGFLVLAVAASASALLISTIGSAAKGIPTLNTSGTAIISGTGTNSASATPLGGNAFMPQTATNLETQTDLLANGPTFDDPAIASATDAMQSDPNNLTNMLNV